MRGAFISTLVELAANDERIVLLTGDLGFGVVEQFQDRYPNRFYNVGVAEQNMVGVATGLAEAGLLPFVYSIAPFATLRPYEFIRNAAVVNRLPVRIVGVGGGVEYGVNGLTHHGLEDVAAMRALSGLTIVAPIDHRQARSSLLATASLDRPIYYRLGKHETREVEEFDGDFELGRLDLVSQGADVAIVALGALAYEAAQAALSLRDAGLAVTLAAVASVSPAPTDDLADLLASVPVVLSVEGHRTTGGLGSLIAEIASERAISTRVVRIGIEHDHEGTGGSEQYLLSLNGLTADGIAARAVHEIEALNASGAAGTLHGNR